MHPYWLERLFFGLAWPEFPSVQVGDVVAVNQPGENPYLTKVLHAEDGARTAEPISSRSAAWSRARASRPGEAPRCIKLRRGRPRDTKTGVLLRVSFWTSATKLRR